MMKQEKQKPEYSQEQLADIQEQILEDRKREHRAIAGDQAYRLACYYVAQDVQRGLYDQELLRTLGEEWERFKKENPVLGKRTDKQPEKKE
jgi:hypothetical protein